MKKKTLFIEKSNLILLNFYYIIWKLTFTEKEILSQKGNVVLRKEQLTVKITTFSFRNTVITAKRTVIDDMTVGIYYNFFLITFT